MKRIIIILLIAIAYSSSAQMEFERVLQVYPDNGFATGTELYFKHDTILLKTRSTHSGDLETNYFYSTDDGKSWNDIRDEFHLGYPVTEKYDFLGTLHPQTFEFYKLDRENDSTTFIYLMNLQGEIQKKVSYPYLSDYSGISLNSIDHNLILVHRQKERMFPFEYNHDIGYSTNRGDTWDNMRPEQELKKQRDINLASLRKIEYRFSPVNKGKMLYNFTWSDGSNFFYRLTTDFNYIDKSYNFSSRGYSFEHLLCYECFGVDKLTFLNDDEEEFDSFDLYTDEKSTIVFRDKLPFLNIDSLEKEKKYTDIFKFWGTGISFLKHNTLINNHKVLYINIRSEFDPENSSRFNYINQIFFQSFDNGKTWEFLFNNENINNQVVEFFINHSNNSLWVLKDSTENNTLITTSSYPVLYKSKSLLTSIEDYSKENFNVSYSNRSINIISDNNFNNAEVNIFNTNGQLLMSETTSIQMGENVLLIDKPINVRLILIQINTDKSQIFKLISSD